MTKSLPAPHAGSHDAHVPANDVPAAPDGPSERFVEARSVYHALHMIAV